MNTVLSFCLELAPVRALAPKPGTVMDVSKPPCFRLIFLKSSLVLPTSKSTATFEQPSFPKHKLIAIETLTFLHSYLIGICYL